MNNKITKMLYIPYLEAPDAVAIPKKVAITPLKTFHLILGVFSAAIAFPLIALAIFLSLFFSEEKWEEFWDKFLES